MKRSTNRCCILVQNGNMAAKRQAGVLSSEPGEQLKKKTIVELLQQFKCLFRCTTTEQTRKELCGHTSSPQLLYLHSHYPTSNLQLSFLCSHYHTATQTQILQLGSHRVIVSLGVEKVALLLGHQTPS